MLSVYTVSPEHCKEGRNTIQVSSLRGSSLPPAVRKSFVVGADIAASGGNIRTHHKE